MKILHIVSGPLSSGAGKGARALHESLQALGVDTAILGRVEKGLAPAVNANGFSFSEKFLPGVMNRFFLRRLNRRFPKTPVMFHPISYGLAPQRRAEFKEASLVHVQFSHAATLGPSFWQELSRVKNPVVFTLRDMWLFTGGCHFSLDCRGYETGCDVCPMLGGGAETLTATDVRRKLEALKSAAAFVAISHDIAEKARQSVVLKGADIRVIPNSIDTAGFELIDKATARAALGLPRDAFIVGFGALNLSEVRKGSKVVTDVLHDMVEPDGVHWAIFGGNPFDLPSNATYFGRVQVQSKLNLIYAAADVFLMPSLQESFGKTTAEALLSGTPVIAFDSTPAVEIIDHEDSGWIVTNGDSAAVIRALKDAHAGGRARLAAMGRVGRRNVLARFSPNVVARMHIDLYRDLIARSQTGR